MIQDQLVDYVSSQMKLGVSRDAIKSALVSAGWVAGDVEDTIKKIEGSGVAAQSSARAVSAGAASTAATAASTSPQMIRVSDLVSSGSPASVSNINTKSTVSVASTAKQDTAKPAGKISGNTFEATSPTMMSSGVSSGSSSGGKKGLIMGIIAVIIILGLGGVAWYFYSGNADLASKVASLTTQSTALNAQLSSLQAQIDASSTDLSTQVATLTAANADLALNLSFYAVPLGGPTSTATTALPVTISGWLSGGGKAPYAITTPRGAKVFVANSTDVKISLLLKPMVGDTVQAVGTYIPGSDQMTIDTVTDLTPAPAAATSTPTSTSPAAPASASAAASSTPSSTAPTP